MRKLTKISIGFATGILGLTLMLFGATTSNVWLLRFGIVVMTTGGWLIAWS